MNFSEYLIKRKKGTKEILLSILIYFAATILSFLCLIFLLKIMSSLAALLAFGCYYAAYKISTGMNKEYEYIFVQDNISIDVIMNASRRKRLISFSVSDVELIAPIDDSRFAHKISSTKFSKEIDATSGSKLSTVYFAVIPGDKPVLIKFEPPHSALSELYKYAPSKINIKQ